MMFRSIRSRLALSFAGIALVAALALGAVLLAILRNYYSNLELVYLRTNAGAIGDLVAAMNSHNAPHDEVQSQIDNMAFLTQTRIRVYSGDNALLYDSGAPQNINVNLGAGRPMLSVQVGGDAPDERRMITVGPNDGDQVSVPSLTTSSGPVTNHVFVYNSNLPGEPGFGFALNGEAITGGARSKLSVKLHIQNADQVVAVELSEGPAYGSAILASVAQGWVFASAIAVLLAAGIGWYISRRISAPVLALTNVTGRMAQGDLSSRADVKGQDEFGQLGRSFNEMADRVEKTVTTLRAFVADAAHELRTPLTVLRTNLDLVSDEKETDNRAAFVADAKAMVQRLEELNTNLLDLSRLEANDQVARDTITDLRELLQVRGEIYASQAEQAGLIFEQDLPSAPVFIRADVGEILRAIDNLVDNACKFTPQNGTVRVTLLQQDEQAMITVADTGVGIPEDELPQLFSRFHRGRNVSPYSGSGLGLAIVKAIVTAHEGRVEVQSPGEGRGSKFSISLAVVRPPDAPDAERKKL
jgi:two-component system sensor histidine kinase BaeS